jgi:hypothetical protein
LIVVFGQELSAVTPFARNGFLQRARFTAFHKTDVIHD